MTSGRRLSLGAAGLSGHRHCRGLEGRFSKIEVRVNRVVVGLRGRSLGYLVKIGHGMSVLEAWDECQVTSVMVS